MPQEYKFKDLVQKTRILYHHKK